MPDTGAASPFDLMRVSQAIRVAADRLSETSDTARLDAEVLMAHALQATRSELLLRHMTDPVPASFSVLIDRRVQHEPVAYITGEQDFYGLTFCVSSDVLIPRGDSEVLVERALAAKPDASRVLDCGTGSGALILSVVANLPQATGIGIDCSPEALRVATANAEGLGLADRVQMTLADWTREGWDEGLGQFDLILSNPPYVEDAADLAPSVHAFEPAGALFSGPDGLDDYRLLIPQLVRLLATGGVALIEIGATQAEVVAAIAMRCGFASCLHFDLGNRPRVLELTRIA